MYMWVRVLAFLVCSYCVSGRVSIKQTLSTRWYFHPSLWLYTSMFVRVLKGSCCVYKCVVVCQVLTSKLKMQFLRGFGKQRVLFRVQWKVANCCSGK